jgi:hypothetical protein
VWFFVIFVPLSIIVAALPPNYVKKKSKEEKPMILAQEFDPARYEIEQWRDARPQNARGPDSRSSGPGGLYA